MPLWCYVCAKCNQLDSYIGDTFVSLPLESVIIGIYKGTLYCPLDPKFVSKLEKKWLQKKVGQSDPKLWQEGFDLWKKQEPKLIRQTLSRFAGAFPLVSIRLPSIRFSYRVQIVVEKKLLSYILSRHFRIVTPQIKDRLHVMRMESTKGSSEYKMAMRYLYILNHYDLAILNQTYTAHIQKLLETLDIETQCHLQDITSYEKETYLEYSICPFFGKRELQIMSDNFGGSGFNANYEAMYQFIKSRHVKNELIVRHIEYIFDKRYVGLVDYYTFQGDRIFNTYLRKKKNKEDNPIVRKWVNRMWKVIQKAPRGKDESIFLWRFLSNDDHITVQLQDGDIYCNNSFMSCSRDPYYLANFGKIVLRIRIPRLSETALLCIETFSRFSSENEILLPPNSRFRVKIGSFKYRHVMKEVLDPIKCLDLELIDQELNRRTLPFKAPLSSSYIPALDIKSLDLHQKFQLEHKIAHFNNTYSDANHQFQIHLEHIPYIFYWQYYKKTVNSSGKNKIRKYYYQYGGYSWVLMDPNNATILLLLEFGGEELHVNFHLSQYSFKDIIPVSDKALVKFLLLVAKAFELKRIIVHSNYRSCGQMLTVNPDRILEYHIRKYNHDVHTYLLNGLHRFRQVPSVTVKLYGLEMLKNLSVPDKLRKRTSYQTLARKMTFVSLQDFFIHICKTECPYIQKYMRAIQKHLRKRFPDDHDKTMLDIEYVFDVQVI